MKQEMIMPIGVQPEKQKPKQYHLPVVVRIRRKDGVVVQGCDVYIGRQQTQGGWHLEQSNWYNPFKPDAAMTVEQAIVHYENYIRGEISRDPGRYIPALISMVCHEKPLTLGCWCKDKPTNPCHGDVIVKLCGEVIEELKRKEQAGK